MEDVDFLDVFNGKRILGNSIEEDGSFNRVILDYDGFQPLEFLRSLKELDEPIYIFSSKTKGKIHVYVLEKFKDIHYAFSKVCQLAYKTGIKCDRKPMLFQEDTDIDFQIISLGYYDLVNRIDYCKPFLDYNDRKISLDTLIERLGDFIQDRPPTVFYDKRTGKDIMVLGQ